MAGESAYTKRLTAETKMDKIEGLLEHFNLPPEVIAFIRKNQKLIIFILVLLMIFTVTFSLYTSYRKRIVQEGASALAVAVQEAPEKRIEALQAVVEKYGSTTSAQWARIEIAHLDMKNGNYGGAAEKYLRELKETDDSNPLYGLLLFGAGQALESEKKYDDAAARYNLLKELKGYEHIGYIGLARIEEVQGNFEKANTTYNNFLLNVGDDPSAARARAEIESRIARLKMKMSKK
ncbi:tetratricopeptide repeat protein [Desulfomarina sp.]